MLSSWPLPMPLLLLPLSQGQLPPPSVAGLRSWRVLDFLSVSAFWLCWRESGSRARAPLPPARAACRRAAVPGASLRRREDRRGRGVWLSACLPPLSALECRRANAQCYAAVYGCGASIGSPGAFIGIGVAAAAAREQSECEREATGKANIINAERRRRPGGRTQRQRQWFCRAAPKKGAHARGDAAQRRQAAPAAGEERERRLSIPHSFLPDDSRVRFRRCRAPRAAGLSVCCRSLLPPLGGGDAAAVVFVSFSSAALAELEPKSSPPMLPLNSPPRDHRYSICRLIVAPASPPPAAATAAAACHSLGWRDAM